MSTELQEVPQHPKEAEIQPVFYNKVTEWDKDQSVIIKEILMKDYKNYELDTDRRRMMVGAQLGAIIKNWIK